MRPHRVPDHGPPPSRGPRHAGKGRRRHGPLRQQCPEHHAQPGRILRRAGGRHRQQPFPCPAPFPRTARGIPRGFTRPAPGPGTGKDPGPRRPDGTGRASGRRAGRHPPHDPHHRLPEKIRGASFPHALRTGAGRPQAGRRLPLPGRRNRTPHGARRRDTLPLSCHDAARPAGTCAVFSGALSCRASPFRARHLPYLGAPP